MSAKNYLACKTQWEKNYSTLFQRVQRVNNSFNSFTTSGVYAKIQIAKNTYITSSKRIFKNTYWNYFDRAFWQGVPIVYNTVTDISTGKYAFGLFI